MNFIVLTGGFEPPPPCVSDKASNPVKLRQEKFGELAGERVKIC